MLFLGYAAAEARAIGFCIFQRSDVGLRTVSAEEQFVRKVLLGGIVFFYGMFCFMIAMCNIDFTNWGFHGDVWSPRHDQARNKNVFLLEDTASGLGLLVKVASYMCEVLCGFCLLGSHLAIWYFCEERHCDLPDELEHLAPSP